MELATRSTAVSHSEVRGSLQRGALSTVDDMAEDVGTSGQSLLASSIRRTIVDHHDGVNVPGSIGHGSQNPRLFIVGWNNGNYFHKRSYYSVKSTLFALM